MPNYSIQGPDGQTYSIDGPEGATREQIIGAIQTRLAERPDPITRKSTVGEELRRGYRAQFSAGRAGIESLLGDADIAAEAEIGRAHV